MCGIVGALSTKPVDARLVAEMRDILAHRGPDHAGLWQGSDGRICLGHRRLAIIDLSPEANQPFTSDDGRFVITFNGEIYNFRALRKDLEALGEVFHTESDTEVLLTAYRVWRENCLTRLSGMFAFAIWDAEERRLFCARDRAGEKPFYYALIGDTFLFTSELKALAHWPGFERKLDYSALADYLTFGFVPDPKSIWQAAKKLPPGHWLSCSLTPAGRRPVINGPFSYWDFEFKPEESISDWGDQIREALERAAGEMAIADVPLGAFLSGGIDSSSVTAALSRAGNRVKSFTIGFDEPEYDERRWAREVADLYRTEHLERTVVADDIAPVMDKLVWHYDEPFNDYSYLPTFYLCREARKQITVALSGDGGDELFAGYVKYQRLALREGVRRILPRPAIKLAAVSAASILPQDSTMRRTFFQHGSDDLEMATDMLATGFRPSELITVSRGPLASELRHYNPVEILRPLIERARPRDVGMLNTMRYLDLKLTLAGDILVKVDRASMAVSLEVRPVYLHRDMLALAARIPTVVLADRNVTKKALKKALEPWLPPSILNRRKMGFAMPLRKWTGNGFMTTEGIDDLIDSSAVKRMVNGGADRTAVSHSLFFLERWLARWS
jgi:asparagine synthase (glutamine-hydrolysing)